MNVFDHVDVWKAKVDPQGTDTIFFCVKFIIVYNTQIWDSDFGKYDMSGFSKS